MRPSVRAAWFGFNAPFEGVVPYLYADVRGLVTVGVGNLVDPVQYACQLPFRRPDGTLATRDEIVADFHAVKSDPSMAKLGHRAAAKVTKLRLLEEDIRQLVDRKLTQMDAHLSARWRAYRDWNADAQLAVLSMAWALGPGFHFPIFEAFIKAGEFLLASEECKISEAGNPGVRPRNLANRTLLRNAAMVHSDLIDPDELYWPRDLHAEAETDPELYKVSDSSPPESLARFTTPADKPTEIGDIIHPKVPLGRPGDADS